MKIKFKILSGFALIIAMLIIAGFMSIYEFSRLSKSVSSLIDDNYKTIEACKTMLEALEREDSGILLMVSGQWKKGRDILLSADESFFTAFDIAKNNITEEGEDANIDKIEKSYQKFKETWDPLIIGTLKENSIEWYLTDIHTNFISTKSEVKALMTLNQNSMYKESRELKEKAQRALMPGIVAIVAALVFLVMFNFLISKYYVKPIDNLIHAVKYYTSQSQQFDAGITSKDEFKDLEKEIKNLIDKIKQKY